MIKSALSPKLIKLMIPPRANSRRLDRVWVPPSTSRQLEGTATASLSLYLYLIQPVASLSFLSRSLMLPKNRARRNYLIHQIDGVKMLYAIERQLSDNNLKAQYKFHRK